MSKYTDWRAMKSSMPDTFSERDVPESTYYKRARRLRREGFLDFEIDHFAGASLTSPGMKAMRRARMRWYERAKEQGIDADEWYDRIARKYKREHWRFPETSSMAGGYNPWEQLESVKRKRGVKDTPTGKRRGKSSEDEYDEILDKVMSRRGR